MSTVEKPTPRIVMLRPFQPHHELGRRVARLQLPVALAPGRCWATAHGASLADLDLRATTGTTVVAVIRDDSVSADPAADFKLRAEHVVVHLGRHRKPAVRSPAARQPARVKTRQIGLRAADSTTKRPYR